MVTEREARLNIACARKIAMEDLDGLVPIKPLQ